MAANFYTYFKENMDGLGLPAPESLFGNLQVATANAQILLVQIDRFGKTVTIGEIVGAGTRLEKLGVITGLSAAFYIGAVVGSIAVATGRSLAGGASMSDVFMVAHDNHISRPWMTSFYPRHPGIYDRKVSLAQRNAYRHQGAYA